MTSTATQTGPLTPGQPITKQVPGSSVVITATPNHDGSCNVTVWQGAERVEGWHYTFPTVVEGMWEASRALAAFTKWGSVQAIDRRAAELAATIAYQEGRKARRMCDPAALAAAENEADTLMPFAVAALARQLRADLTDLYTHAA